jgi:hypothetical protein
MPVYEFKNTNTGEVVELVMSISARDQYVEDNPHMEPHHSQPIACSDPVRLGLRKIDHGFTEVLNRIKTGSGRGNTINTRR